MKADDFRVEILKENQIEVVIPLVKKLNPKLSIELLEERLKEMITQGYECLACYDNKEQVAGICGLWTQTRFYSGKFLEPDNVFIEEKYRSFGLGQKIMKFVEILAKERGCDVLELNCYLENDKGNHFWERQGFKALGYHYQKSLS